MFVALHELRAAWGRFMLMGVVIALVSALVGMVSGFTIGLGNDTVSALRAMPTDSMVFAKGTSDFTRSVLTGDQVSAWARHSGVNAHPLGIGIFHGETSDDSSVDMAVIGAEPHSPLLPATTHGRQVAAPGEVVVSEGLANSGIRIGDSIRIDNSDVGLHVVGITDTLSYGHVAAAYVPLDTWRLLRFAPDGNLRPHDEGAAGAIALTGGSAPAELADTHVVGEDVILAAAPGYSGERLTMNSIIAFLYVIAPLIVAAFFAVWVVQRRSVYALQRALGVSRLALVGAALAQAAVVVVLATVIGSAIAYLLGLAMGSAVPFDLPATSLATTGIAVIAASMIGSAVSLRWVLTADPQIMLGESR
ncbi:ABC transporter permease [Gordonia otitidis]|uniref:FtsX-like permease family protein n=1 Tax=Gordonia otitidis TaxID=249058 RepID=UPI001D150171|nr:FtsX-like permease family protein [Gordonia otitidis]UEA59696.1 ABC transporter permease [Gordonia otitidis]